MSVAKTVNKYRYLCTFERNMLCENRVKLSKKLEV